MTEQIPFNRQGLARLPKANILCSPMLLIDQFLSGGSRMAGLSKRSIRRSDVVKSRLIFVAFALLCGCATESRRHDLAGINSIDEFAAIRGGNTIDGNSTNGWDFVRTKARPRITIVDFKERWARVAFSGTASQQRAWNQKVANDVAIALRASKLIGYDIGIEVKAGTAILTGQVPDEAQRNKAENVAANVRGIKIVDNQLTVRRLRYDSTPLDNQEMADRIAVALGKSGLSGFDLEVWFTDGEATIAGAVANPEQRATITQVVANIAGVVRVANNVKVAKKAASPLSPSPLLTNPVDALIESSRTAELKLDIFEPATTSTLRTVTTPKPKLDRDRSEVRTEKKQPKRPRPTAEELFKTVSRSVVRIDVWDAQGKVVGHGSGFFIQDDSTVVTNFHVINRASSGKVLLHDGEVLSILGTEGFDPESDIAILKVARDSKRLIRPLILQPNELPPVGCRVYVIGSPLGLGLSLTDGRVSRHDIGKAAIRIQITAPISPGSSGSPVLDEEGNVVGVVTSQIAGQSVQNLNLAAPVTAVKELLAGNQKLLKLSELSALKCGTKTVATGTADLPDANSILKLADETLKGMNLKLTPQQLKRSTAFGFFERGIEIGMPPDSVPGVMRV